MFDPYFETERGALYLGNGRDLLPKFPEGYFNLTITSPPYDDLREYCGCVFDFDVFRAIASELYRVTAPGGVVVWVAGDGVIDGGESGTSFRQALHFIDVGFTLYDTMIYEKNGPAYPANNRYYQVFEYMFILTKGKPETVNLIKDRENVWPESTWGDRTRRGRDGELKKTDKAPPPERYGVRFNIWRYNNGAGYGASDNLAYGHPAIFPERLAADHILTWSNEGDVVLDCFFGSGTVGKVAERLNREWVGVEISPEYCELAAARIRLTANQKDLFAGAVFTVPEPERLI